MRYKTWITLIDWGYPETQHGGWNIAGLLPFHSFCSHAFLPGWLIAIQPLLAISVCRSNAHWTVFGKHWWLWPGHLAFQYPSTDSHHRKGLLFQKNTTLEVPFAKAQRRTTVFKMNCKLKKYTLCSALRAARLQNWYEFSLLTKPYCSYRAPKHRLWQQESPSWC